MGNARRRPTWTSSIPAIFGAGLQVVDGHARPVPPISHEQLREVFGEGFDAASLDAVGPRGMGAVLRSHIALTLREAPHMTADERVVATRAATDMAAAALQAWRREDADDAGAGAQPDAAACALYDAACLAIRNNCSDAAFTPVLLASQLGCSRSSLYRLFSRNGKSVAAMIWSTRLDRAWHMISANVQANLLFCDIAFRCGFVDQSTFNRMFKRRYGISPREARRLLEGSMP
jgi:AraC-like DNA-binding protein